MLWAGARSLPQQAVVAREGPGPAQRPQREEEGAPGCSSLVGREGGSCCRGAGDDGREGALAVGGGRGLLAAGVGDEEGVARLHGRSKEGGGSWFGAGKESGGGLSASLPQFG